MDADAFLAAAREYRSWDDSRKDEELRRLAAEHGCDFELSESEPGVWRAAFTKPDDLLDTGRITMAAAETGNRSESMENLLLTVRFQGGR